MLEFYSMAIGPVPLFQSSASLRETEISSEERTVQQNLQKEFFKRLPGELKAEILDQSREKGITDEELDQLDDPRAWRDRDSIRKMAIRACMEGKLSEKRLGHVMLHCMIEDAKVSLPGKIKSLSTRGLSHENIQKHLKPFCTRKEIDQKEFLDILGDPSCEEDAFFIVDMDPIDNPHLPFRFTAMLSRELYPYFIPNKEKKRLYVFQPHVYERVLRFFHSENPEKPLFVLGTRNMERFSDNERRVLSMTGGPIPTPNIEANKAWPFFFYLHDGFHIDLDSAMGLDRNFWNGFGKHLLDYSKHCADLNMRQAFKTLGECCVDKEFQQYLDPSLTKLNGFTFLFPFITLLEVAGKKQVDDQEMPFQPICQDPAFATHVQKQFFDQLQSFWKEKVPRLELKPEIRSKKFLEYFDLLHKLDLDPKPSAEVLANLQKCLHSISLGPATSRLPLSAFQ